MSYADEEIIVRANMITGRIQVATDGWAAGDPRWKVVLNVLRPLATTIDPFRNGETSMDRATAAVESRLGLSITSWRSDNEKIFYATVTGDAGVPWVDIQIDKEG